MAILSHLLPRVLIAAACWALLLGHTGCSRSAKSTAPGKGKMEFRIAPASNGGVDGSLPLTRANIDGYRARLATDGPTSKPTAGPTAPEFIWLPVHPSLTNRGTEGLATADRDGKTYVLVSNRPSERMLADDTWGFEEVRPGTEPNYAPAIDFKLNDEGAKRLAKLTSENLNRSIVIIIDGQVIFTAIVRSTISDRGQITGKFTLQEVQQLVKSLRQ